MIAAGDDVLKRGGERMTRTMFIVALLAVVATGMSYALHLAFGHTAPFSLMPALLVIMLAHVVFVREVRQASRRKTTAGRWVGLTYFAAFLAILITAYGSVFAEIGIRDGGNCGCQSHDLPTGLFFSVVTWTTVGYGDVTATAPIARFFAAAEALNGYLVLALFIAALVPVFQDLLQAGSRAERPE